MEKINYRYEKKGDKGVILTHGLGGSIESKSLKSVENFFKEKDFSTLSFDMVGHGESEGDIQDLTLTKIYKKIVDFINFLKKEGIKDIYLYGVSLSAIPIVKAGIDEKIKKVFLRSPALEMYAKRNRELGLDGIDEWEKNGKIFISKNYKTGGEIYLKYSFMEDLLENFHRFDFYSQNTDVFICSGTVDIEVPIKELRFLLKYNKNFDLKELIGEGHSLSENGVVKMLDYIGKNI